MQVYCFTTTCIRVHLKCQKTTSIDQLKYL